MPSCHHVVPSQRNPAHAGTSCGSLEVGASLILKTQHPHPKASVQGIKGFSLTLTCGVCAGADFTPNPFSAVLLFPLGFNSSQIHAESEPVPAAAAAVPRHGHWWDV